MRKTHVLAVPLAGFALTVAGLVPTSPAIAAPTPAPTAPPGCYGGALDDFNGDRHADVAVGEPHSAVGKVHDAGAVEVRYGCGGLPTQELHLPHAHAGDRFGSALADGYYISDDALVEVLFVGVPYLDVKGHKNAGGVAEFHGSSTGLTFAKLWTQASAGVPGKVQSGAHFGAALSLSDENEERFFLRIGEPGKNVGHATDTGGVVTLSWAEDPEEAEGNSEEFVSSYGAKDQDGDLFGSSISVGDTIRVGAPGRRVDGHRGAGAVFENADPKIVTQDTPGVPGAPEAGDHFGTALSENWIGVPDEALGSVAGAGLVQYWDPRNPSVAPALTQDSPGIPGAVGAGHHFGASLAYDGADRFSGGPEQDYLVVGAPGDASTRGSATLLRIPNSDSVVSSASVFPGAAGAGTRFGASLAISGRDRVIVGAPDEGGGLVHSYRLPDDGVSAPVPGMSWTRGGSAPPAGTSYGAALPGPVGEE